MVANQDVHLQLNMVPGQLGCDEKNKKDSERKGGKESYRTSRGTLLTGLLRSPLGRGMPADGPFLFFIGLG
jgi:hypothetical protein